MAASDADGGARRHPVRRSPGVLWLLVLNLSYAATVAALSLAAAPPRVPVLSTTDWLAHGLAYGLQVVLLHGLFRRLVGSAAAIAAAGAVALAFGATMEALQLLQPSRYFEGRDLAANAVGVGCAVAGLAVLSGAHRLSGWRRSR
jgi:VanZ family protein